MALICLDAVATDVTVESIADYNPQFKRSDLRLFFGMIYTLIAVIVVFSFGLIL